MAYRIFVSAVSEEFGDWRREAADELRHKELEVREQKHFRQGPGTLLEKLRDYIRDCDAVICLVGHTPGGPGSFPSPEHVAALGEIPAFQRYQETTSLSRASYTQWEYLLAKEYNKDRYVYLPAIEPDEQTFSCTAEDRAEHAIFRDWLMACGEHYDLPRDQNEFIRMVLRCPFPDFSRPKTITLLPPLESLFKGRDDDLEKLKLSLGESGNTSAAAIVGRAVHGLGGVGKTRLANEYGWKHEAEYTGLFFVSADTPANLSASLAALAGAQYLDLPQKVLPEEEARLGAVQRWMQAHPKWLLILDNVDTDAAAAAVKEMLRKLHGGHVLITSRIEHWGAGIDSLPLDELSPAASTEFLLERTAQRRKQLDTDAEDAAALATELDGLALALEQAGAYIACQRRSLREYLELWRTRLAEVAEWHHPGEMDYRVSVAVTWQTTMDQLGAGEIALLRMLAWFAPDPIPLNLFESNEAASLWREAAETLARDEGIAPSPAATPRDALARLAEYSMLRWHTQDETVALHRVVQQIVRLRAPEGQRKAWLERALNLLQQGAPYEDAEDLINWTLWGALAPHADFLAKAGDVQEIPKPAAMLMTGLGRYRFGQARWAEADGYFLRALELAEAHCESDPYLAEALTDRAVYLKTLNRHAEAEPLFRRAQKIDEDCFGPEHPGVAMACNNLASLLEVTNRPAEAEPLYRRALKIYEDSYGPEHADVAMSCNNLALLLAATNRHAEAEPLYRRALKIDEDSFGPEHPKVARGCNKLAALLASTGRSGPALVYSLRAVKILLRSSAAAGHELVGLRACIKVHEQILERQNVLPGARVKRLEKLYKECGWRPQGDGAEGEGTP